MRYWSIILLLVVATLATFGRAVWWDFTSWDDPDTVWLNSRLNPSNIESVAYYWRHPAGGLYTPVTYTYWGMLSPLARQQGDSTVALRPGVYHAGNILLHTISVVLVLLILRQLIESDAAACFGALLFALHPVQVEPVAWVSGAKDVLAGMFSLLAIDQLLRFSDSRRTPRRIHYLIALIAFTLAILSKPSAVVAPLIGAVLVWVRFAHPLRSIMRWIAPMLILALACIIWSRLVQAQHPPTDSPIWARPLIAIDAIAFYLWKLIWPMKMGIVYGRTPAAVLESGFAYWTWIPVVISIGLVWYLRNRLPRLVAGAIVFVLGLMPVLGLARFEFQILSTVADRYLYLAMLGVAMAVAGIVSLRPSGPAIALAAGVLVGLSILSMSQLRHWRDSEALYLQALRVNPASMVARDGLGKAYAMQGRADDAIAQFQIVVAASPTSRLARTNLAQALLMAGQHDEAIAQLERSLRLANPGEDVNRELYLLGQAWLQRAATQPATEPATQPNMLTAP